MKKTYLTPHTLFGPFAFCGVICQGTFPTSGDEYDSGGSEPVGD